MTNKNKFFKNSITNILLLGLGFITYNANAQINSIPLEQRSQYSTIEKHLAEKKRTGKLFAGNEAVVIIEKNNKEKVPYYSDVQIRTLDELLEREDYAKFFEYFSSINVDDNAPLKYLITKTSSGHIPLFWLMANSYALDSDAFNTHKWLYVALIMTTQDTHLCTDRTALTAPKTLLRDFPHILTITTRTPQHIQPAVEDAARFIRSLKHRTNPKWACSYGSQIIDPTKNTTYDPAGWILVRKDVLTDFLKPYNIK